MADNRERARTLADRIGIIPDDDFANAEILAEIDAAFSRGSASIADEATVERVARALCASYGDDYDDQPESGSGLSPHHPGLPAREDWRRMARAALDALPQ